ncbi:MAG: DUF4870 domain-containing protein [Pirellulaceae bacterium]
MSNYGGFDPNAGKPFVAAQGQYYQPTADDRTWAMLAHISPIVGLGFIGPLVVWLIYKDKSPFVADQAKESLNFNLAVLVVVRICVATCVGIVVAPVVGIGALVYQIIAAMEANKGVWYRYPYTIRMIN